MEPLQPLLPSPCEEEEGPLDEGESLTQFLLIFITKRMEKGVILSQGYGKKSNNFHQEYIIKLLHVVLGNDHYLKKLCISLMQDTL